MTDNLERVIKAFERDNFALLVSHTVMPWIDSVATLHDFAERIVSCFTDEGFGESVTSESAFFAHRKCGQADSELRISGFCNSTLQMGMSHLIEGIQSLNDEF